MHGLRSEINELEIRGIEPGCPYVLETPSSDSYAGRQSKGKNPFPVVNLSSAVS